MQFARCASGGGQLLDHIELCCSERIYDLGCGTGIATELLARRWPLAELYGVDSSVEMLEEAARLPIKAGWERANLRHWCAERLRQPAVRSGGTALLEDHGKLLPRLLGQLTGEAAWRRTCRTGAMLPGIA